MLTKKEQDLFYKATGDLIKIARNKSKISQEKLAKELGFVSRISIVHIESGKQKVQMHTLIELADLLSVSIDKLTPTLESIKQGISSNIEKQLTKETSKQVINDVLTIEKIKSFIRLSSLKNK